MAYMYIIASLCSICTYPRVAAVCTSFIYYFWHCSDVKYHLHCLLQAHFAIVSSQSVLFNLVEIIVICIRLMSVCWSCSCHENRCDCIDIFMFKHKVNPSPPCSIYEWERLVRNINTLVDLEFTEHITLCADKYFTLQYFDTTTIAVKCSTVAIELLMSRSWHSKWYHHDIIMTSPYVSCRHAEHYYLADMHVHFMVTCAYMQ